MSVKREEVARIARLAHLDLSDDELDSLMPQFQEILGYVARLKSLPTQDTAPLYHGLSEAHLESTMREDRVAPSLTRDQAVSNAPQVEDGHFVVPKIIG